MQNKNGAEGGQQENNRDGHAPLLGPVFQLDIVVELEEVHATIGVIQHFGDVLELVQPGYLERQLPFLRSDPAVCALQQQPAHNFGVTVDSAQ